MAHNSRSVATRAGIALTGLAAAIGLVGPLMASEPAEPPVRRVSNAPAPPAPDPGTAADPGCLTVDANGVRSESTVRVGIAVGDVVAPEESAQKKGTE